MINNRGKKSREKNIRWVKLINSATASILAMMLILPQVAETRFNSVLDPSLTIPPSSEIFDEDFSFSATIDQNNEEHGYEIIAKSDLESTYFVSSISDDSETKTNAPKFESYSINPPGKALESRLFRPLFVATPSLALNIPSTTPLGENFTFTASFSNSGADPGYGPFIDIVLPAKGVDGVYPGTDPSDVYDGISFISASFSGISIPADQLFVQTFPDDDGSGPGTTGCVTHPIAVRPAGGANGHGGPNPESPVYYEACGESGYQFVTIVLPFGSFVPAQPAASVTITAHMSELADLSQPLNIRGQAGFRFGNTPINDFCCDPWDATLPVDGDGEYDVLDFGSVESVEPSLLSISKSYTGVESETATGPNFERSFIISVDIANNQVIGIAGDNTDNLVITDILPDNIQYLRIDSSSPPGAVCTTTPSPLTTPGGEFSCSFDSVTGTAASIDASITFDFFVDRLDESSAVVLDPVTGALTTSGNTASVTGTWDPVDSRDDGPPLPVETANCGVPCVTIQDQSITVQKSYLNTTDGNTNNSPGDVIEYTLNFQVSDFFGFEDINLTDTFSDGQRFDTTFAPTIQLNGNGGVNIGSASAMNAANVDIDCKYTGAVAPSAECDTASAVFEGNTTIIFNISDELISRTFNGQLLGGCVNPTTANNPPDCNLYNDGPTEGTITFRTVIQDEFSDEHNLPGNSTDASVDHGDVLENDVNAITGEVLTISTAPVSGLFAGNGNYPTDDSGVGVNINFGVLTKDVFAVNGSTSLPPYVSPGDVVTYRLTYTQPTSDFETTVLTDFFPLPVFSSSEIGTLNNQPCATAYSPAIVPPAGVICLGAADDYHNLNLPSRGELLAPAIPAGNPVVVPTFTTDPAANSLTVTYASYDSVYNIDSTMQLLISLTVESDPFADGLFLTNQATSAEGTTNAGDQTLTDIVQIRIGEPDLITAKTAVSTDHLPITDLEFIADAALSGPELTSLEALMAQFAGPGGAGAPFSGTISSQDISTDPNDDGAAFDLFNSTLVGVDGDDLVKYAILIENKGHSENGAYDIAISDILPTDMDYPDGDPLNLNLQIYNGAGVELDFEVITSYGGDGVPGGGDDVAVPGTSANASSLFDPTLGIRIVDPSGVDVPGACQVTSLTSGANIIVITYDLQLNPGLAPDTEIINTVSLLGYGAEEGGDNFLETPDEEDARVITKPEPDFEKELTSTALNPIAGYPNNGDTDVVIGEILTYTLEVKFFELDYTNVSIVDTLDPGLSFVDLISVTNSNPDTDGPGADTGLLSSVMDFSSGSNCADCVAGTTGGSNPLVTNNGGTVTFDFGDLTNNDEDNTVDETITIIYRAVATNVITSDAGDLLGNSAELSWDSGSLVDDDNDATLLEPYITTLKEANPNLTDAGNLVTYTVTLTNGNGATDTDAYDVVWTDTLPAGMNYTSGPILGACPYPPNSLDTTPPELGATWDDANEFPKNSSCVLTFTATVDYSVNPGEVIPNVANTTWTSLPGSVTNVAGDYNTDDDERTGDDGVGVEPDDYASTDTGSVTITNPALQKYLMQTSEPHTAGSDVAIGEIVRYRLVVSVPEGTSPNFQVRDDIPAGLIFLNDNTARLSFISDGPGITSTAVNSVNAIPGGCTTSGTSADNIFPASPLICLLGDTNIANTADTTQNTDVYNSDTNVFFRLGNLVNNDNDPDAEYVVIEFNALSANTNNNDAGDMLSNTARSFVNGVANGAESGPVNVTVAEPLLDIDKVITTAASDANDPLVYRITVTNSGAGANPAAAFDLHVNDPIDPTNNNLNLTSVAIFSDGSNGSTAWAGICGSTGQGVTDSSTLGIGGTVSVDITCLNPGETVAIVVNTTVIPSAPAGVTLSNETTVIGTSLPGGTAGVYDSDGNGTGSNVPGNPGTITGERDGSDTNGGGRNDYYDVALVNQTLNSPAPVKSIESTSEAHTDDTTADTIANPRPVVIGEVLRYSLAVTLPEGTNTDLTLVDIIPAGLTFMPGSLELEYLSNSPITNADGPASTALMGANTAPITLPATYFDLIGQTLTIDLESPINNDNDGDAEYAVLEFNVLVNNDATNQNATVHDNHFSVSVGINPAVDSNHVFSEVREPKLNITKTADSSNWHYGDPVIYSLEISHVNSGSAALDSTEDAFDITITDAIPTELTFGSVISIPGSWTQSFSDPILTLECLDINSCSLPLDNTVTISFTVTVNTPPTLPPPLPDSEYLDGTESAVNTANMVWTSLPGTGTSTPGASGAADGERNGNASGENDYNDSGSHTGELNYYALGNRVWFDTDNSATINGTEVGVGGVTVELYDAVTMLEIETGPDGILGNADDAPGGVTTDLNGYYLFDYLEEGDYYVVLPSTNFTTGVLAGYYSSQTTISDVGVLSETAAPDPDNDIDSDDNGTLISGDVVSLPVTLGPLGSTEPTNDNDLHPTIGHGHQIDGRSNLSVDFGFYRKEIGDLVYLDEDANGNYDSGTDTVLGGVTVELFAGDGFTSLGSMTTNGSGLYLFENLPDGNYYVRVQTPADLVSTIDTFDASDNADPDDSTNNNDNGIGIGFSTAAEVYSGQLTLVNGEIGATITADDSTGTTTDLSVDFGFTYAYAIGNQVWFDTDNSATMNGFEDGIDGVVVELYLADSSGNPTGSALATDTTASDGYYLFDYLTAGDYVVVLPASNFSSGAVLNGYWSSASAIATDGTFTEIAAPDPDNDTDLDDNGTRETSGGFINAVISEAVTVGPTGGSEPTGESNLDPVIGDGDQPDNRANMTVDFGFYRIEIGNLVFADVDKDGRYFGADTVYSGAVVQLFSSNGTEIPVGLDGILGTADDGLGGTVTNSSGIYTFSGLPAGDYIVGVTAPTGTVSTIDTFNLADNTDPDINIDDNDNGIGESDGVVSSGLLSMTPGSIGAQNNNTVTDSDGTTSNPTVDFGFSLVYGLGNRVWFDTDNNSQFDAGEVGVDGVTLELYAASDLSTVLDTDTTANGGYYLFDYLEAGDYVVLIPASNFGSGATLEGYWSSATSRNNDGSLTEIAAPDPDDDTDSDDNGTLVAGDVVSLAVTLGGLEPTGEFYVDPVIGQGDQPDDQANMTVDFGFYTMTVGNLVWIDTDNSGTVNGVETGVDDVTLQLWTGNGLTQLDSTTTAGGGIYSFTGQPAGDYIIRIPAFEFEGTETLRDFVSSTGPGNAYEPAPDADTDTTDSDDNGSEMNGILGLGGYIQTLPITLTPAGEASINNNTGTTFEPRVDFGVYSSYLTDLAIDKDDGVTEYVPGSSLTYTIRVDNFGPSDVTGASVVDNFPPEISSVSWTCVGTGAASCTASGTGNINDTAVNIPFSTTVDHHVTYTVVANIDSGATVNPLVNTATINPPISVTERDSSNNSDDDSDTPNYISDLRIDKDDGVLQYVPGGTLTYTIIVDNDGPSDVSGASVTDTFPPEITSASWTCAGSVPAATCTTPGSGNINDTVNIPAGENVTYTVNVSVDSSASGVLTNVSNVDHATDSNPGNNQDDDQDTQDSQADLTITKDDGLTIISPNTTLPYTIDVINNGPSDVVGATVVDTFPVEITSATWTCVGSVPAATCTSSGSGNINDTVDLPAGEFVTYMVNALVSSSASGSLTNTVAVTAPGYVTELDITNNDASDTDAIPALTKTLTGQEHGVTTLPDVAIGEIITYRVELTVPIGTMPSLHLIDSLDQGLAFVDCVPNGISGPGLTMIGPASFDEVCDNPIVSSIGSSNAEDAGRQVDFDFGTLENATGNPVVLTVVYRVVVLDSLGNQNDSTPPLSNEANWVWASGDLSVQATGVTILEPDLSLSKSVSPNTLYPGQITTFTLIVDHTPGSQTSAYEVELTDILPTELIYQPPMRHIAGQVPSAIIDGGDPTLIIRWDELLNNGVNSVIEFDAMLDPDFQRTSDDQEITNEASLSWTSLPGDFYTPSVVPPVVPQSPYNTLSTERWYDPLSDINIYGVGDGATIRVPALPDTGFAPGVITDLPLQSDDQKYSDLDGLQIDIPKLDQSVPIVSVPLNDNGWDLTWLWNQAGWLEGTAYPSWIGNTVITGHAYLPSGLPGPFVNLGDLTWGDELILYAHGLKYTYQVRSTKLVAADDYSILQHKDQDWLTLFTCKDYNDRLGGYIWRQAVQAVLIDVENIE